MFVIDLLSKLRKVIVILGDEFLLEISLFQLALVVKLISDLL
jgi:hypothetical protein